MSPTTASTLKRTTRARKTVLTADQTVTDTSLSSKALKPMEETFTKVIAMIAATREEYEALQKQIAEIKEAWDKEQRLHIAKIQERDQQEEIERRRENETYAYETALSRKKAEDEFLEKKAKWEKELEDRKEEIVEEKQELEFLRKQVDGFEEEKEKAVKEASLKLQKELTESFATEKKLREQEVKAENELLALKITNLTEENTRLSNEIDAVKKALENATAQLKDIAVKVIESSSPQVKPSNTTES